MLLGINTDLSTLKNSDKRLIKLLLGPLNFEQMMMIHQKKSQMPQKNT
jgi:hypothetical protein